MNGKRICSTTCLIPLKIFFRSEDADIQKIIDKISKTTDFSVQQECIKAFAAYIVEPIAGEEKKELVLKLLAFLFISCISKNPIKKTIGRTLSLVKDIELLTKKFSESLKIQFEFVQEHGDLCKKFRRQDYYITAMHSSFDLNASARAIVENFSLAFKFAFTFLSEMVDYLWERKESDIVLMQAQQYSYIFNTIKFLLSILQKSDIESIDVELRLRLITCCYDILIHKSISYDTKSNCGHIIVILLARLPEDFIKDCDYKNAPYLELLKFVKCEPSQLLDNIGMKKIEDVAVLEIFKVCVYVGILIVANNNTLWEYKFKDKLILSSLFKDLIVSAKRCKGETTQIMGITKGISIISSYLSVLPNEEIVMLFKESLDYVMIYLDDKIDVVRSHTKNVFINFLKLALKGNNKEDRNTLLHLILNWFKSLPVCSIRYTVLTAICSQTGCLFLLKNIPHLPKQLFNEIVNPSTADDVSSCYVHLMRQNSHEEKSEEEWVKRWVNDIVDALRKANALMSVVYRKLFVSAFNVKPTALKALLCQQYLNTDSEICAFLLCLHSARKTGLQIPLELFYNGPIDKTKFWRNLVEFKTLEILQTHQSEEVRLLVLETIVDCHRTTEKYLEWEIEFLPKFFYYNINTSNPSIRQQLISLAKKAITRIQFNIILLRKNIENSIKSKPVPAVISKQEFNLVVDYYCNFWKIMFTDVLLPGLNPDSNYGRKSMCLELLQFAFANMSKTQFYALWHKRDLNNLKCILQYDTYERNKDLAAQLLTLFTAEHLGFHSKDLLQKHIEECFSLAISIKPAQTISAAYMLKACLNSPHIYGIQSHLHRNIDNDQLNEIYNNKDSVYLLLSQLMFELNNCCLVGQQNLQTAAASKPIHGFVFCIRHLLRNEILSIKGDNAMWKMLIQDLLDICFELGKLVRSIICNQSPEGYLPNDSDYNISGSDETAKAQMITVYGWRATKEISLLLGEIALKAPLHDETRPGLPGLIDESQIKLIGVYFFDLLIHSKHRGAFEQASVGFCNLCYRLWRVPNNNINCLPTIWLQKIMNTLLGIKDETFEACATRRSAGVPFLVQAIVIAKPNMNSDELYQLCMKTLLEVGGGVSKPDEQRIHCLNILRGLYRHNQLSEFVIPFCASGVIIAIEGFGSSIWGIRNSATLLFASLMVKIFGVPRLRDSEIVSEKNKMMAQVFFVRYPELYKFLLDQLRKGTEQKNYPSLFPVLLVLSRLYRDGEGSNSYKLEPYLPYIRMCMSNPVYKIRDLAAKTLVNLISPKEVPLSIARCFVILSNPRLSNTFSHGILLQLQYLFKNLHGKSSLNIVKIIDGTSWIIICSNEHISHLTASLYLEIILDLIIRFDPSMSNCDIFKIVSKIVKWFMKEKNKFKGAVSTALKKLNMHMFNLRLCLLLHLLKHRHSAAGVYIISAHQTLLGNDMAVHRELRAMCINFVNYLNPVYVKHNLHEQEETEHTEIIRKILRPLNIPHKIFLYEVLYSILEGITIVDEHKEVGYYFLAEAPLVQTFILQCFPREITDKQELLMHFVSFCNTSDDQTVSYAIAYLNDIMQEVPDSVILDLGFDQVVKTLLMYCAPSADLSHRLGICKLLVDNKRLFYTKDNLILSWSNLCLVWEAVFILLEDDDEEVRNTICRLCQEDLTIKKNDCSFIPQTRLDIPEYAREILLNSMIEMLPNHCSINILLSWILRGKEITTGNVSEVFDEGELNTHAELFPMAKAATIVLHKLLWKLEDGLNFKDRSIFIEEQSLLIATILYDKFYRNVVPFISYPMKMLVRNILARTKLFLEKVVINESGFKENFRKVFTDALQSDLVEGFDVSELIRLKMFLGKIFKLILWD